MTASDRPDAAADSLPSVSFIVPVRNDAERLRRCLAAIAANTYPPHLVECIVADNGSTDDTPDVAGRMGAKVVSLPAVKVSELRNRAAAIATRGVLAFVDADHEIGADWISSAASALQDERVAAVGALYLAPPDGTWTQRMYGVLRGRTKGRSDTPWLASGNLAVRRRVFEEIGGFDVALETCEDVEFCQRVRSAGWRIVADERLTSIHAGDPPTLGQLFLAERWRGRDNLRVSVRVPMTARDLPSIVIPILDVFAIVLLALVALAVPIAGNMALAAAALAAAPIVGFAALRAVRMSIAGGLRQPREWVQAWSVALVYDLARAMALILPAGHRRSTKPPMERPVAGGAA